jgi:archaellum component FlaF (FlaF/FlaG flagellin family)
MSEKRTVSRNVAIALGITCIVLIALIAYFTVTGIAAQNSYNNLENKKKQLQASNTNLQNQMTNLTDIVNLSKSTVWANDVYENLWDGNPTYNTPLYEGNATYAGYIAVQVSTQWPNNTAEVTYTFQGLSFDDKINFNGNSTATFRIMPSSNIKVYVYTEAIGILTGPLDSYTTITYYY